MSQPKIEIPWGWETPSPSDAVVTAARQEVVALMQTKGWKTRPSAATVVFDLATTVNQDKLINIATHITISLDAIEDAIRLRYLPKAAKDAQAVMEGIIKTAPYHVTVAAADEIYNADNPRWFSNDPGWQKAYDPDAADLATAVTEARKVLGRK